jgi:hypothetical protein
MTTEPKPMPDLLLCPFKFIQEYYPMTDTSFSHSQVVHLVKEAWNTRAEPVNSQMLDALEWVMVKCDEELPLSYTNDDMRKAFQRNIRDACLKAITAAEQCQQDTIDGFTLKEALSSRDYWREQAHCALDEDTVAIPRDVFGLLIAYWHGDDVSKDDGYKIQQFVKPYVKGGE